MALAARGGGGEGAGQAGCAGPLALAGSTALQARGGAHQLQGAYRRDGGTRGGAERQAVAGHRHGRPFPQSELVAGRPVRGRGDPLPRTPQRARGRACDHLRQARQRYPAREGARLRDRLQHRPRHDRARSRGPQLSQIDRHLLRARAMAGHRRRDSRSGQRAAQDFRQRRAQAEQQYQAVDLRLPQADRMGLDLLHLLSRRRALYRNARGREPGQAGRHHARADRPDRRDVRSGPRPPGGRVGRGATRSIGFCPRLAGRDADSPCSWTIALCTRRVSRLQVKRIGQATLATPDLERQLDYYTRVVGLSIVAKGKGRAILATKPGQEAIALEHGERPAGVRLAFQVAPGSDLGDLSARLSKAGIKSERRSGITPGIAQAIVFTDPKGTSVEIFSDYTFAKDDDSYTGVMPRKLGHVAFHTPDVAATVKFYCDVLGFKVSDWRSDFFAFLRCSRDHHTINLLQADNANIHHLAFELRDEAEINRACDFLARKNIKLFWGPIRLLIGHNIAIYHKNPDAITVEFFTDLDLMYDEELGYFEPRPWHQDRPQRPKVWGDDTPTNYWGPGHPHDMPRPKK